MLIDEINGTVIHKNAEPLCNNAEIGPPDKNVNCGKPEGQQKNGDVCNKRCGCHYDILYYKAAYCYVNNAPFGTVNRFVIPSQFYIQLPTRF